MSQAVESLVNKLMILEREIAAEKGEFTLFGLFLPEDTISWDLVVTAPWIVKDRIAARHFLAGVLQSRLDLPELRELGGIHPLMDDWPFTTAAKNLPRVEHGRLAIGEFESPGRDFRKGYLITNQWPDREPTGRPARARGVRSPGSIG